jgi:hypothetical protein
MLTIWIINIHSQYSYRKRDIEHLLSLTDSFTWEELPTRDPDTGYLTKAAYIPIIQRLTNYLVWFVIVFHTIQSTFRIVFYQEMIFTSWFPFDTSSIPAYVLASIIQVGYTVYIYIYWFTSFSENYKKKGCVRVINRNDNMLPNRIKYAKTCKTELLITCIYFTYR